MSTLFLASTSPRRLDLLRQIGLQPRVLPVAVDEAVQAGESAAAYVERLARAKAEAGAVFPEAADAWVLAADTTVMAAGRILGKPASLAEARDIWACLTQPDHQVLTGIALLHDGVISSQVVCTQVRFAGIPEAEQRLYWASGEPQDKAGAYAIQGRAALYVQGISGSYSNVVGLPLAETAALLRAAGYPLWG